MVDTAASAPPSRLVNTVPFVAAALGAPFLPTVALPVVAAAFFCTRLSHPMLSRLGLLVALVLPTLSGLRGLWTPWGDVGWLIPILQGVLLLFGFVVSIRKDGLSAGTLPRALWVASGLLLAGALLVTYAVLPFARPLLNEVPSDIPLLWTQTPFPEPDANLTLLLPTLWITLLVASLRGMALPLPRRSPAWALMLVFPLFPAYQALIPWLTLPVEDSSFQTAIGGEEGELTETALMDSLVVFRRAGWSDAERRTLLALSNRLCRLHGPKAGRQAALEAYRLAGRDLRYRAPYWASLYWNGSPQQAWRLVDEQPLDALALLRPGDPDTALLLSRTLQRKGRLAEAAAVLENAVLIPSSPDALALDKHEQPLTEDSTGKPPLYGDFRAQQAALEWARLAAVSGDFATARRVADDFLRIAPDFPPALTVLGLIHLRQGDADQALFALAQAYRQGDVRSLWLGGAFAAVQAWREDIPSVQVAQEYLPRHYEKRRWIGSEEPVLFVPGSLWMEVECVGGRNDLRMEVRADTTSEGGPHLRFQVNGEDVETREITDTAWHYTDFAFQAHWGINEIRVSYDDDIAPAGEDRNLPLGDVWIRPLFKAGERR